MSYGAVLMWKGTAEVGQDGGQSSHSPSLTASTCGTHVCEADLGHIYGDTGDIEDHEKKASSQILEQHLEGSAGIQGEDCLVKCPHDALWWQQGRVQLGHCWTTIKWVCIPSYWDLEQVTATWAWSDLS